MPQDREEVEEIHRATPEEQAEFNALVDQLFEGLWEMEAQGKISLGQIEDLLPKDVVARMQSEAKPEDPSPR